MEYGDLISRQSAIDAIEAYFGDLPIMGHYDMLQLIKKLPSAQPSVFDSNVGEWDMFELITSAWYGKQCYFLEKNGIVYSRVSCKYMSVDEAIKEFLGRIGDNG